METNIGHVLIIEDELLIALDLQLMLEDMGCASIDLAATEAEAIALAISRPPSLIISDVRLAEGTGPAAVATIRKTLGDVPVIFSTGNPDALATVDADHIILTKPIGSPALSDAMRNVKRGSNGRPSLN